jgi:predicted nucleic acid-binding protein
MTIHVQLDPEMEAKLVAKARSLGLPPEQVALDLLQEALVSGTSPDGFMSVEELRTMLAGMAEGSKNLPQLPPESLTRESFYRDRE